MPAVLDGESCPSCGTSHDLCLDDHRLVWRHREFEYTCPVTGDAVRVRTALWTRVVRGCPDGSVPARPTD